MAEHGLIEKGWSFYFDRSLQRFGCCHYTDKRISLSRHLVQLNGEDQVRDTILHEIAHGVVREKGYYNVGHGWIWQQTAVSIGCNGERTYDDTVLTPDYRWVGTCPNCGTTIRRHRRRQVACGKCCKAHNNGRWDQRFLFEWTDTHADVETLRISL